MKDSITAQITNYSTEINNHDSVLVSSTKSICSQRYALHAKTIEGCKNNFKPGIKHRE
jgi:hypothetical protein